MDKKLIAKDSIIIFVDGGIVQDVFTNSSQTYVLIDYDTEGASEEELHDIDGDDAYVEVYVGYNGESLSEDTLKTVNRLLN